MGLRIKSFGFMYKYIVGKSSPPFVSSTVATAVAGAAADLPHAWCAVGLREASGERARAASSGRAWGKGVCVGCVCVWRAVVLVEGRRVGGGEGWGLACLDGVRVCVRVRVCV